MSCSTEIPYICSWASRAFQVCPQSPVSEPEGATSIKITQLSNHACLFSGTQNNGSKPKAAFKVARFASYGSRSFRALSYTNGNSSVIVLLENNPKRHDNDAQPYNSCHPPSPPAPPQLLPTCFVTSARAVSAAASSACAASTSAFALSLKKGMADEIKKVHV